MLTLESLLVQQGGFTLTANLSVPVGTHVAVMGPSGAGKSTLLLAIAGFCALRSGRILWQGMDIARLAAPLRPAAMLFQDQNLFPHLSLLENVVLGLTAGKRAGADQIQAAQAALARVGLGGLDKRKPAQISGGQAARAALARMLLQARPIWLLDEPFAALDQQLRRDMLALTAKVARETKATVLMVTHQTQDAAAFADLVIALDKGNAHAPISADVYLSKSL